MTKKEKLIGHTLISLICIATVLYVLIILSSCKSTGITITQKAKCIYNSGSIVIFEYSRIENYKKVTTEYKLEGNCKGYEVGRYYGVVVKK